jgi:uncharacterized membrane protein
MLRCIDLLMWCFPMQHPWVRVESAHRQEWLSRQNCSISPRQLALIFGSLVAVSLTIAALFALSGAWLVLPFALIEVLGLGVAFVVHARHAADYERITLSPESLTVEVSRATRLMQQQCTPAWTRVEYQGRRRELIGLVASGRRIEVGRFVPESDRRGLANELRTQLQGMRS